MLPTEPVQPPEESISEPKPTPPNWAQIMQAFVAAISVVLTLYLLFTTLSQFDIVNKTAVRPFVAFYTQTVGGEDLLRISNVGVGPALNVVGRHASGQLKWTFNHRILLGPKASESIYIQELSPTTKGKTLQADVLKALLEGNSPVDTCIRYEDLRGDAYYTWQRFAITSSRTEFSIEVLKKTNACP